MNISQIIVTAVLTTLTLLALATVTVWSLWPRTAEAGVAVAAHTTGWHESGNHCQHFSADHLELGQAVVTVALDLDDAQQAALAPVRSSLENWRSQIATLCETVDHDNINVDTGLQSLEQVLSISAATVAEVRPHLSGFVAGLTPEQSDKLKSYMSRHHHKRGYRGHH